MAQRTDTYIPDYANGVAVAPGNTFVGSFIPLYGANGALFHIVSTNGAAGTLYLWGTNFQGNPNPALQQPNAPGMGVQTGQLSVVLAANGSAVISSQPTNTLTLCNGCYAYFSPTAAGNIYIAVNIRRINN